MLFVMVSIHYLPMPWPFLCTKFTCNWTCCSQSEYVQGKKLCHFQICLPSQWRQLLKKRICSSRRKFLEVWAIFFYFRLKVTLRKIFPCQGNQTECHKVCQNGRKTLWCVHTPSKDKSKHIKFEKTFRFSVLRKKSLHIKILWYIIAICIVYSTSNKTITKQCNTYQHLCQKN